MHTPSLQSEKNYIVDYAYGFHANTCEVDYVCRLRCLAALRALKNYPNAHIVLGAGMKESTGDCGPLSKIMANFLLEHGVTREKILENPNGNNTLSETEAAYAIIKKRGGGKVICTTSRFHATRVWLIWFFRFGIGPELFISELKPQQSEYFKEIGKVPRDIIRSIFHRIKKY